MKRVLLVVVASCGSSPPPPPPPPPPSSPIVVLDAAPADALELQIRARRWQCEIVWPDGVTDLDLRVPSGRPIRLVLRDTDSVEDLDAELGESHVHLERGAYKQLAFRIDRAGTYAWKCPVQQPPKGSSHRESIIATVPPEYDAYHALRAQAIHPVTLADKIAFGKDVFERKGCNACHTVDGSPRIGISMAGIWGKEAKLVDGTTRVVDASFIYDALDKPTRIRRDGYPPTMPIFTGMIKPDEIEALTLYIESLK